MNSLPFTVIWISVLCCTEVRPQVARRGVAGVDRNVVLPCVLPDLPLLSQEAESIVTVVFWIINGSVYGLLQIPPEFTVCSGYCDSLTISVLQRRMDGYTFQCVSIDYVNSTQYLGEVTELIVYPPPTFISDDALQNILPRDVLGFSYPQFSVGPVNTTIGWTYSNLTCHPSLFIIQGYADRDDIPDNPSLNLTSASSVLTFPTNFTNGSLLYWRILAHDVAGTPCAQESTLVYYYLDTDATSPIPISPSSDGVGCVPIPVGPRHDYSSLEVVWPERRDTVERLCYCPPFEGEHHLFSRCISTTSCGTDYSITVSNGSVCYAELSPLITSIPVYFTLLESCADSGCVVRSVLTSYIIEMDLFTLPMSFITMSSEEATATNSSNSQDNEDINTQFEDTGTTTTPNTVPYTLIVAVVMGTLFLIVLLCCPPIFICYCYKDRKMKELKRLLRQTQEAVPSPLSLEITSQDANLQPPEYEEIQGLQATTSSNSSGAPDLAAAYMFTKCPAYGQVPMDILSAPPLPPHTSLSHEDIMTPRTHEYEDVEKVRTMRREH